jgi:hypothetical protein
MIKFRIHPTLRLEKFPEPRCGISYGEAKGNFPSLKGQMDRQGPSRRVLPSRVIGIVVEHTKVCSMVTMALKGLCSHASLAKPFASRAPCRYLPYMERENFKVRWASGRKISRIIGVRFPDDFGKCFR